MNQYFEARERCPACEGTRSTPLCRAPYTESPLRDYLLSFYSPQGGVELEYLEGQDYVVVECKDCGLIYQGEIPNGFLMHRLYESWIDPRRCFERHERFRGIEYFAGLSTEIVEIVSMFGRVPMDVTLLDFSMGWGHWCRVAQSFGCRVHGTEISPARIEYARRTGVAVIDGEEIQEHRYDFINMEQVCEHLPDVRTTVASLTQSLKRDGILKISVPDGWDVKRRLKTWDWQAPKGSPDSLNPVAPLEHVNCFNHSSLLAMAERCGLVPVARSSSPLVARRSRGVREGVKAVLRPYWHRLRGFRRPQSAQGTCVFFRLKP